MAFGELRQRLSLGDLVGAGLLAQVEGDAQRHRLSGQRFHQLVDPGGQLRIFPDTRPRQLSMEMVDEFGYVLIYK